MSIHGDIEDVADSLRTLAKELHSGSIDPEAVAHLMNQVAEDLYYLARKLKRAAAAGSVLTRGTPE